MNKEEYRDWEETFLSGPTQAPVALLYTETLRLIRCIHDSFIKYDLPVVFRNFHSPLSPATASLCRSRSSKRTKSLILGQSCTEKRLMLCCGDFVRKLFFYSVELEGTDMWTGTYHESGEQFKHRFFSGWTTTLWCTWTILGGI